jgi:UDP-glucose 4-epimerase
LDSNIENWLIVGGAGYIGSHVARTFEENGSRIVLLDDLSSGLTRRISSHQTFVKMDARDTDGLIKVINEYNINGIVHLAAMRQARESFTKPIDYWTRNVGTTLSIADAVKNTNIEKLVYSSSCSVYGESSEVDRNTSLKPISPYGNTKLAGENIFQDLLLERKVGIAILRYFNVIGCLNREPFFDETNGALLPKVIPAALRGEKISIYGHDYQTHDGTAVRDYIDVRDLANAHVLVAKNLSPHDTALYFNVSSGNPYSVLDVVKEVVKITLSNSEIAFCDRANGDPAAVWSQIDEELVSLGWSPSVSLRDSIRSHVDSYNFVIDGI